MIVSTIHDYYCTIEDYYTLLTPILEFPFLSPEWVFIGKYELLLTREGWLSELRNAKAVVAVMVGG